MHTEAWDDYLPAECKGRVAMPVRYEKHEDPGAHASKLIGFDPLGRRCYYAHQFMMTEQGFDADEFPIEITVYRERVVAWRLGIDRWLRLKVYADQPERCAAKTIRLPPEITNDSGVLR